MQRMSYLYIRNVDGIHENNSKQGVVILEEKRIYPATDTATNTATDKSEIENDKDVNIDFKAIIENLKKKIKTEHLIILFLIIVILLLLYDRENMINSCNSYWINELEKYRSIERFI